MQWDKAKFLNGIFSRDEAAFSRRDMLAGLGLAALFVTAPKLLAPGVAEAKPQCACDRCGRRQHRSGRSGRR